MYPSRRFTIAVLAALTIITLGPSLSSRIQGVWARSPGRRDGPTTTETRTSFSQLLLHPGSRDANTYVAPIHYGTFADVEIGSAAAGTVQIEVTVLEQSALRERRTAVLIPGRVLLVSEILGVENLLQIGSSSLLVRITTSEPVSAILVRGD